MLSSTLAFFSLTFHSFIPGFCLLYLLGVKTHRLLVSFALSITILVLTHFLFRAIHSTIYSWLAVYYFVVFALLVAAVFRFRTQGACKGLNAFYSRVLSSKNLVFLIVSVFFGIYYLTVGTYSEIPSDYWQHVARVQENILRIANTDQLGANQSILHLIQGESPFYQILALLASALNVDAIGVSHGTCLFLSLCFLVVIYFFSYNLAARVFVSNSQQISVALISTIATLLWLGTASFSYVRYYAFSPGIVNVVLLFAALGIVLDHLDRRTATLPAVLLLPFFFVTMALIHIQESLFLILMVTGLALFSLFRVIGPLRESDYSNIFIPAIWSSGVFLLWTVLAALAAGHLEINRWGYTPHIIDLGTLLGTKAPIPVVNPAFRLWDTVGLFGVTVLVWYLFNWKRFRSVDYINVGVLLPFITCLNPAFVWLFLHYGSSTVVWRITYLMPMGIVFGFLSVWLFLSLRTNGLTGKTLPSMIIGGIAIVSLLPFTFFEYENRTSRFPSLWNTGHASGYPLVEDLFQKTKELSTRYKIKHFLTDSVTGFVLYAGLRGEIRHWLTKEYFPQYNSNFDKDLIESDFSRYLLIVNRRNGEITDSSRLAGHWDKDILQTSRYYPMQLETFLESKPNRFDLLWEYKGISIYLIHDTGS